MPSMPLYFWGDPDGQRYREAYFDMYPGVWRHGDWIEITERGTAIISGRSDATINRGGIRMGTSGDLLGRCSRWRTSPTRWWSTSRARARTRGCRCSSSCATAARWTTTWSAEIRRRVREDCSPRHVPSDVVQVQEVPRTLSGKVLECRSSGS